MPKITPFLWFDTQAEEAAQFYVSLFPNSRITGVARYPEGGPRPAGMAMTVSFVLDGAQFTALNGGPQYSFDNAVSFVIPTKDQAETDHYYDSLLEGGVEHACGWVQDRFGLAWQITPDRLMELISSPDKATAGRAMGAMMTMKKIDIAAIEAAAAG
ncbi:MAG TPA: VOC family protein [Caulobacteraceae bacterium]|jgi:predicted 3-demethylubiquinone-9 3-methyltransferase (glyoxalase superfamily)